MGFHWIDWTIMGALGKPEDVKLNLKVDEYWELGLKYPGSEAVVSVKGGFLHRHTAFASEYAATFEKGSVRASSLQPGIIHIGTDAGAEQVKVTGDAYARELEYFAGCIIDRNKPERCLPEESVNAIEACQEIRKPSEKEKELFNGLN